MSTITATRAKFRCYSVTDYGSAESVILQAVTDDGDPENKAFWTASPSGKFEITISNPAVRGFFQPGVSYYLDIAEAE